MPRRSLAKRLWYRFLQIFFRVASVMLFRIRCHGRERLPEQGGALVLSNHQSHLDPVLLGLACDRRLNFLARDTLFRFAPFRWLIRSLDAIPIDREGLGMSGLKETLRRLKHEEMVLIFPEGTRTRDGEVAPLKPGFSALAKRAKVPLVPVAIEGAFEAWPRWRMFPGVGVIQMEIGRPILPAEIGDVSDRELVAVVQRRIEECLAAARRRRNRRCWYNQRPRDSAGGGMID
jgi:1-acyl-sn-glycerol-3-phosphate acyltransferase